MKPASIKPLRCAIYNDALWLAGFASWKAIEAYAGIIWLLAQKG